MVFTEYFMEINFIVMDCYGLFVYFMEMSSISFWIVKACFCFSYVYALSLMFFLFFLQFNFPVLSQTKSSLARFGLEVCFCWTNDFFDSTPSYIFQSLCRKIAALETLPTLRC